MAATLTVLTFSSLGCSTRASKSWSRSRSCMNTYLTRKPLRSVLMFPSYDWNSMILILSSAAVWMIYFGILLRIFQFQQLASSVSRGQRRSLFFKKVFFLKFTRGPSVFSFFLVLLISSAVILSQPNCSRTEPWKIMALWCLHAHWSHTVCLPTEINTPSEKVLAPFKIAPAKRSVHVGVLNDTSSPGYGAKWRTGS